MIKTGLIGYVYDFFVDYNIIDTSNIISISKHLLKKHSIKECFGLLKKLLLDY